MTMNERPIGVFDSGVGGLAVARAIKDVLPEESIYYIGDTANVPYGEKDTAEIQNLVQTIVDHLLLQPCKVIVIACATATVAAAEMLIKSIPTEIPIFNVVTPVINHLSKKYPGKKIGLIGTQYTVDSNYYNDLVEAKKVDIKLSSLATPLLVPMIETDIYNPEIVEEYVRHSVLKDIAAMVLGCTHYGLIKQQISTYYPQQVELIGGAELLAQNLCQVLQERQLINSKPTQNDRFMMTRLTNEGIKITRRLFGEPATCQEIRLDS